MGLKEDLQQQGFKTLEEEAMLNLARTMVLLEDHSTQVIHQYGITPTQYNVLRILRGAGSDGLCRNQIRDRMLDRMPDMTRLLDRMEDAGLVERERSTSDRRQVPTRLTEKGLDIVNKLDDPVHQSQQEAFGHLSRGQLITLIETLTQIREKLPVKTPLSHP
ncbi:MarR family winged helix-turn-helix transcriptional regulator [Deinococcus cellulosilyticus]|uniref:MarR family transcriptional regulator n=1 Tax=Deinococcus cellulosilyticus (strain DSM 18568 / NBRC 106333 / KACC 11606 / 5516J-15) TaxID=1223518 RepID=A0A511N842_DEIC1|nr:MarR family transcriptional regulator [Deinococcus cellulosilyticus]GEM48677.1 MarR family transcriptional regulator [Deinococcus cellulosilyticus NBRC 106333 = KACC 11606]